MDAIVDFSDGGGTKISQRIFVLPGMCACFDFVYVDYALLSEAGCETDEGVC